MSKLPKTITMPMPPEFQTRKDNIRKGFVKNAFLAESKAMLEMTEKMKLDYRSRLPETQFCDFKDKQYEPKSLKDVDLLLIGITGNGKSALGNTILGYSAFESKSSLNSVTKDVTYGISEWNGYRIKVVDGPSIGDTRMDINEATRVILQATSKAIALSPLGFHSFLLVVKFGGRFTKEDKITVDTLKKIFGEHFFKKFCIIVMTCGDQFEEEENTSFQEWVKEQKHDIFTDLLKECNGRIVLFNNQTQDVEKKKAQLNELFQVIESLKEQSCRYSDELFNMAPNPKPPF